MLATNRMRWMDMLRGTAIILIIIFHSGRRVTRYGLHASPEWLEVLNLTLAVFRMPVLTFLSGYLVARALEKTAGEFLNGKLRNLLWPYFVWTAIYFFTAGAEFSFLQHELYISYLWFLAYLFVYYVAALVLKRIPELLLISVALGLAALTPQDIESAVRFFYLWAIFMLGTMAGKKSDQWLDLVRTRWLFIAIIPISLVGYARATGLSDATYSPEWFVATLSGLVLACGVAVRIQDITVRRGTPRVVKAIEFIGRNSLIYYVSHIPIIWATVVGLRASGFTDPYSLVIVCIALALAVGTVLAYLKHRPFISLLFHFPSFKNKQRVDISAQRGVQTP